MIFSKHSNISAILDFYFPHMKYGKYWFHLQFFFNAKFYVLGLFILKKRVKREKNSVCHAALPWVFGRNLRRS
jgi:hypothetical protein